MRTILLAAAVVAAPALAAADEPPSEDPRARFGLAYPDEPEDRDDPPVTCDDGGAWPCVVDPAAPGAVAETLTRERLIDLGAADAALGVAAARALGGWIEADRQVAFPGSSALEARWLVDGFPLGGIASGGRGLHVLVPLLETIDVVTAGMPAGTRASTGAVVDAELRRGDAPVTEATVWTRVTAPPRRLPAVVDVYDPLVLEGEPGLGVSAVAVHGGPLPRRLGGWYLVGLAPSVGLDRATRIAQRLRDVDGDGLYDRHPDRTLELDRIDTRALDDTEWAFTGLARLGHDLGPGELVVTGLAQVQDYRLRSADGTIAATAIDEQDLDAAGWATWAGRWGATGVTVTAGWYRQARDQGGIDAAAEETVQIGTAYIPAPGDVPEDAVFAEACVDDDTGGDPYPRVFNCPLPTGYYVRGGAGLLVDTVADRPVATVEVTRRAGAHRLAAGVTGEDARLVRRRRLSGGVLERRLDEELVILLRFVQLGDGPGFDDTCAGEACRILDVDEQTYRTRHLAAWIEDAWEPADGLHVAAGLRWSSMEVGPDLAFRDQIAPRVAVALDPTRRGRARIHASWGRYHAALPAELGRSLYETSDVLARVSSPVLGQTEQLAVDTGLALAGALAPVEVDELAAGAEWVIADAVHVGATVRHRRLWRGLDDVGGLLVTPGLGEGAGLVPLRRESTDVAVWLASAPTARLYLRAGWLHSRQVGTWAGPHDPIEGATLYRTAFDGSTANAYGRLPFDLPHRFVGEVVAPGGRRAGFDWTIGARFEVASGRPVGANAGSAGEIPLLPRGSVGRMPATSAVILHVAARRGPWEVGIDLIDLFDRRAVAAVDERWTTAEVRPIEGGDETDLLWLRDVEDARVRPNPGYGVATRYVAPVLARLFVSARF